MEMLTVYTFFLWKIKTTDFYRSIALYFHYIEVIQFAFLQNYYTVALKIYIT